MRILMFGWEFPPHISGGLGTACFGIAHALIKQKTSILFVVPRAHGDETMPVINASDIFVDRETEQEVPGVTDTNDEGLISIPITASITPYLSGRATDAIEHWNWEYGSSVSGSVRTGRKMKYQFSGGYGIRLMDEVFRFGEVSSAIAETYSFDVIHAHDWLTYPAGIRAKQISGQPLIVHVHATEFDRAGGGNIDESIFKIEKRGMEEADVVVAVSEWTKQIIVQRYGITKQKVRVVHNGIIPEEVTGFNGLPGINAHIVTFLGRITYQKGPEYFIDAARRVLDYFPDTHFVMAGSGDLLPSMIDRVAQLKLSSRIHFTGFLKGDQMHQIWSVTDLYVMPSVSEPFGITPLEAVQAGVPVIISKQSGVSEVLHHAIKVDFWDTTALADAMINVLRHKALSRSLRENSIKEIQSLTWERAAKTINKIYHEFTTKR